MSEIGVPACAVSVLGVNDASGAAEEGLLTGSEREEAVRATGAYLGMSVAERAALAQLD